MQITKAGWLAILAVIAILVSLYLNQTKQLLAHGSDLLAHLSGKPSAADETSTPAPGESAATSPNPQDQTISAVEAYMHRYAAPGSTLSFLDWPEFAASGNSSVITAHYRAHQPGRADVEAWVRFALISGTVARAEVVRPGSQSFAGPGEQRAVMPRRPPVFVDHFSNSLINARDSMQMSLQLSNAFSLAQLDQAKAKAQAERKPIGFLMVWGQFFGPEEDTRGSSSVSALMHFYQVFNNSLVLVFVRHETELSQVPPAVRKGFFGPDEGGFAPNMAVTDASATEFITEIPFRGLNGAGRDPIFAQGAREIDQWWAAHPDAMPTPAAAAQ